MQVPPPTREYSQCEQEPSRAVPFRSRSSVKWRCGQCPAELVTTVISIRVLALLGIILRVYNVVHVQHTLPIHYLPCLVPPHMFLTPLTPIDYSFTKSVIVLEDLGQVCLTSSGWGSTTSGSSPSIAVQAVPVTSYIPGSRCIDTFGVLNKTDPDHSEPTEQTTYHSMQYLTRSSTGSQSPVVATPVPSRYTGSITRLHYTVLAFLAAAPCPDLGEAASRPLTFH